MFCLAVCDRGMNFLFRWQNALEIRSREVVQHQLVSTVWRKPIQGAINVSSMLRFLDGETMFATFIRDNYFATRSTNVAQCKALFFSK